MRLAAHWVTLHPVLDPSSRRRASSPRRPWPVKGRRRSTSSPSPTSPPSSASRVTRSGPTSPTSSSSATASPSCGPGSWPVSVTPWRARRIAQTTVALTAEAAAFVDEQAAWCANRLTPTQLERLVDHARARFMPDAARRPRSRPPPTGGTSRSPPTRSPTTAPSTSRPTSRSPTPSASPTPSPPAPPGWPPSARPTPSTAAAPPPSATSPATNKPSGSTKNRRPPHPRDHADRAPRPPAGRRDHWWCTQRHRCRLSPGSSNKPAAGCCPPTRSAPGADAPTCPSS